ncbi:MAG: hypothetical protein KDD63_15285 [Bacteroidetes bacterium]|nr:hypothetical protein [Bacteroidota bacterium]MCB0845029.1 hypothetical protein [Bacteroidota bacterium]MCB0853588.1 hypothetical protein [Bacteroidota bacterium]
MRQLSYEAVEETFDWLSSIDDDDAIDQLIDEFGEKQPFVFSYLLAMGEEDFHDEEQEVFLYMGMLTWKVYDQHFSLTKTLSEEDINQVKRSNLGLLEDMEFAKTHEREALARGEVENSVQPELLTYLIEIIEEEGDALKPGNRWLIFAFLKVLVDAFNQAVAE